MIAVQSVYQSCLTVATLWTVACQAPLFPDKNTGVGCHLLLQGIFLTQGSNPSLLQWLPDSLPLSHLESPLVKLPLRYFNMSLFFAHLLGNMIKTYLPRYYSLVALPLFLLGGEDSKAPQYKGLSILSAHLKSPHLFRK